MIVRRPAVSGAASTLVRFFVQLPYLPIELDLPLIDQFAEGAAPAAKLDPDVRVVMQRSGMAQQRDAEIAAARALMR